MNKHFYPPIEPYQQEHIKVSQIHDIYVEQCGNQQGIPILFLHGGPGATCSFADRRLFDPQEFRIVLFDQRGCGRSTPNGELAENDPDKVIADIEFIRKHLGIDKWHVFGGSWGSTLSLIYAQAHPSSVSSLVLRGIWLLRDEEVDWWLNKIKFIQPEIWNRFNEHIAEDERGDLLEAYWRRLNSSDIDVAHAAAKQWSIYEASCCTLEQNSEFTETLVNDHTAWSLARLEASYSRHHQFNGDKAILNHIDKIKHIPAIAIHGRYDIVTPIKNLLDLADAWPDLDTVIVAKAGHSSHEKGITKELVAATKRIAKTGSPVRR